MSADINSTFDLDIEQLKKAAEDIRLLLKRGNHENLLQTQNLQQVHNLTFSLRIDKLKQLRVACIMDQFTRNSYAPECILKDLTPTGWEQEIDVFQPHLVFVESAWHGKDKLWYRKIAGCSKEYFAMTSECQKRGIPIIFWNKEDPVYIDTFMAAARMADIVFTTDIDCIQKYKKELGHEHVYHLHFAAQPRIHNPIEMFERKDRFCFAGAYYHRYRKRAQVFDRFAAFLSANKGLDIYDRNYKNARHEHAFPHQYDSLILGRLEPEQIHIAYKGYYYGVNMNSISQSQTMFARRVFELLASNTITVGNYSRGVKNYFGELTINTDDAFTLAQKLEKYCGSQITLRKYRLLGLRKVLTEHLYEDRLAYIVKKVFSVDFFYKAPKVAVLCIAENAQQAARMVCFFRRQTYKNKDRIYIICDDVSPEQFDGKDVCVYSAEQARAIKVDEIVNEGFVAVFSADDYYGRQYINDLMLALRYGNFDGVGKEAYYSADGKLYGNERYKITHKLSAYRAVIRYDLINEKTILDVTQNKEYTQGFFFCADEFSYCANEHCAVGECSLAEDLKIADQGMCLADIEKNEEQMRSISKSDREEGFLSQAEILILTNRYPSADSLYQNMFVHERVLNYYRAGIGPEVFQMNVCSKHRYREFEGISVIEGTAHDLAEILESGRIKTVCVHFLEVPMWSVLKNYIADIKILIWFHGSEIQPWWRRKFLYQTQEEKDRAQGSFEKKRAFWNEVFDAVENNASQMHFIFVSKYFMNTVCEDYGRDLRPYSCVIPNGIDTALFSYSPKTAQQRKNIISIRPFSSSVYANDLTVKAIQHLANEPFFSELHFLIAGDGELFDEITRPLKKYRNIHLHKGFLRQEEIARLYQQAGIVLIPSRSDTQGVSRDEAMACGLVPVTNAVAAIPEFADDSCGVLAPGEDARALAEGVKRLYKEPDYFLRLSHNAAYRIKQSRAMDQVVYREIELF